MYDAENMVKFLSRLDSKLAYKFVNEFARFEIYIGNHSRVSKLLDIYRCNLGIGLDTGPCFGSERDLIAEAIKLYQENEKERGEYQIVYDDLATYTELAITLSRDIAAKGHLEESHRIISELIYTMKRLAVAQGAEDRLAHEIRNCSLYSLSILLNNAVMRSTQGYSDTSDKVLLQMSILPILEFFSALKLEDLPQPISLYIKGALVLAICNMGKDYQSIDSPAVNSDELRTFTHLLEVIVKSNPKYTAIGRKMVSMYEFNLEFQRARKFIDQYNIRVPKGTTEVLAYKEKLLHDYGTISNIPIGTPFPLVKLEPLDPILIYDHAYEYKCDLYNKIVDKPLTLDDCVWVIAREINSSGNGGQGLLLNVGGDQIYGIWSRVGTCLSGFFPSYNYKIMDLHNSNLDGITIAGTNDCVWRLHAIVDLMMAHPLNLAKDYGTARELAQHIYNIVKIKCEYLFEKCVLVDSVSMLVDPHTHNSKVSNSGQTVANFSDLKSSDAINHRKFKDIITVKL
ncbi:hypothetical protein BMR1_01G02895 [Babesia microti strain RI]|uniref:Uncharacterized protein n=1 Tax=Babesia microti (strain RI) TaxID=1133968 RepID=I7I8C0_BABMR|nr:hypothetical protein BMR1_01G02895 [Babesia microti strain RI]CCF73033.1 hypothetical protein BMR1_01G02895 [Babesia microti strain RI]|eukprot:XP_012647642.1 hypothetical protein BMR1_01G02895 [Babesia microti strain RI]